MFCSRCGVQVDIEAKFCSSCGTNLTRNKQTSNELASASNIHMQTINSVEDSQFSKQSGNGNVYATLGWVFFVISIFILPIIFGPVAFIMGILVRKHADKTHGTILMFMAVIGTIIGFILKLLATFVKLM